MDKRRALSDIADKAVRRQHSQKTVEFLTTWRTICFSRTIVLIFLSSTQQPKWGPGRLVFEVSRSHTIRHTHTYIDTRARSRTPLDKGSAFRGGRCLHNTQDEHPCLRRDSNLHSAFPPDKCFQNTRPTGSAQEQPY